MPPGRPKGYPASSSPLLDLSRISSLNSAAKRRLILALRKLPTAPRAIVFDYGRPTPQLFATEVLGWKPTERALHHGYKLPWTPDQQVIMDSVIAHRYTAVTAGIAVGKTRLAALISIWWLYSHVNAKVVTTAPTWTQVKTLLWSAIHGTLAASESPLPGIRNAMELKLAAEWYMIGITTKAGAGDLHATNLAGHHSPHELIVLDEATGISEQNWNALEGLAVRPGDRILALGNPTDVGSHFHEICSRSTWHVIQVDCRNHPNVLHNDPDIIPGAVTTEWIQDRLADYETESSPLFQAKVAGQWPSQSADALINLSWIATAQRGWVAWEERKKAPDPELALPRLRKVAGLDVAGMGEDLTVLSFLEGDQWTIPIVLGRPAWHVGRDVMQAVALVCSAQRELGFEAIAIDDTGLGQGCTARLRQMVSVGELQLHVIPVNFAQAAQDKSADGKDRFSDVKDQLWWNLREALRLGQILLPPDHVLAALGLPKGHNLIAQLTTPFYGQDGSGRVQVYDKRRSYAISDPELRERVQRLPTRSPDLAHSLMLALHARGRLRREEAPEEKLTPLRLRELKWKEFIEKLHKPPAQAGWRSGMFKLGRGMRGGA